MKIRTKYGSVRSSMEAPLYRDIYKIVEAAYNYML